MVNPTANITYIVHPLRVPNHRDEIRVTVSTNATFGVIKEIVAKELQVNANHADLIWNGKVRQNDFIWSLSKEGDIHNTPRIHFRMRLIGG